jgi:hypothetical protein
MKPRYRVTLSEEERSLLEGLTRSGKTAAHTFIHSRALLLCDAGPHGSPWKVADVAEALGVTPRTIEHLKGIAPGKAILFAGGMKVIDWRHEPVNHFIS